MISMQKTRSCRVLIPKYIVPHLLKLRIAAEVRVERV